MDKLRLPSLLEAALFVVSFAFIATLGFQLSHIVAALAFYAIVVFGLNNTFLSRGIRIGLSDIRNDFLPLILTAIICILLLVWEVSLESIFFIGAFFAFLLYRWDSRVLAGAALISLFGCVVALLVGDRAIAEQLAIYAYYFLVITVVLQIIEFRREGKREAKAAGAPRVPPLDLRSKQP